MTLEVTVWVLLLNWLIRMLLLIVSRFYFCQMNLLAVNFVFIRSPILWTTFAFATQKGPRLIGILVVVADSSNVASCECHSLSMPSSWSFGNHAKQRHNGSLR